MHKDKFTDQMINNIQLKWKLVKMLRTYRICNWTVGISKYEFYNKLLGGVTLLRVTPGVTWTQPIYIYNETNIEPNVGVCVLKLVKIAF